MEKIDSTETCDAEIIRNGPLFKSKTRKSVDGATFCRKPTQKSRWLWAVTWEISPSTTNVLPSARRGGEGMCFFTSLARTLTLTSKLQKSEPWLFGFSYVRQTHAHELAVWTLISGLLCTNRTRSAPGIGSPQHSVWYWLLFGVWKGVQTRTSRGKESTQSEPLLHRAYHVEI